MQAVQPDWNVIRELYNNGMALKDIAKQTGLQLGTIASRASRGNWKATVAKAKAIAQNVSITVQGGEKAESSLTKSSEAVRTGLADVLQRSVEKIQAIAFKTPKAALKANQELESVVRNAKTVFGWSEGQSQPSVRINVLSSFAIAPAIEQSQAPVIDVTPTPIVEQEHDRNTLPPGHTPAQ